MKIIRVVLLYLGISASVLPAAVIPHIGFVYPSGALPGAKLTVTIGGQYIKDFAGLHLSGIPVEVRLTDYMRIYDQQEMNRIRRAKETIEAKIAEETNESIKQQLQRSLELVNEEMEMVNNLRRADRQNPGVAAKKQFNPQIAERITLEIALPTDAKPGNYDLRVITTNGLSNPILFQIGQMHEISEKEPNNLLNAPERLRTLPVLINGQIMPGDMDYFRFNAKKGQTLVLRAEARSLVPYLADAVPGWFQSVLTLYDAQGREVAYNDDYCLNPDPVLIYEVPANGDYTVSIRDSIFRGREDFVYRLSIGELPFIERISPLGGLENSETDVYLYGVNLPCKTIRVKTAENDIIPVYIENNGLISNRRIFSVSPLPGRAETEPNNLFSKAEVISNSVAVNGTIGIPGDQDWFKFEGREGETKTVEVSARRFGSPLDARLIVLDAKQQVLVSSDDVEDKRSGLMTHHADARIDFKLPSKGTYFVRLDDLQNKGGDEYAYRLIISEQRPDFQLRIVPSSLRIPQGGNAVATVHAVRTGGFNGAIDLSIVDAPHGIELQKAVIPEGAGSASIIIAASKDAERQMTELEISGTGDCGRTVRRRAVPAEDMMQAFIYRHLVPSEKLLVQVAEPDPATVVLKLPQNGIIRARSGTDVTISAAVTVNQTVQGGAVKLSLSNPPEWLSLQTSAIKNSSRNVVLKINPNAEPGYSATVLLNGAVRIGKNAKDPDFNPVMKVLNTRITEFTIDAITIEIVE